MCLHPLRGCDPMGSSREAEQLPRFTHRPSVPTRSVNTATVHYCAESPPGIWGNNIGLFLKDLLMYSGCYKRLDNYCQK